MNAWLDLLRFARPWVLLLLLVPTLWLFITIKGHRWRWHPKTIDWATLLRLLAIVMLILALAGPRVGSQVETRWVYFVLDLSRSAQLAGDPNQLLARVRQLAPPKSHTRYGLIVFGRQPFIEQSFQETITSTEIHSEVDPEGTDIAAALRLALDSFPSQGGRSIVLLSDGRPTQGQLDEVLAQAVREGVQISTVPLESRTSAYWVAGLDVPQDVALHLPFTLNAQVSANDSAQGTLAIYRNGVLLPDLRRSVEFSPGLNTFTFKDELSEPGIYQYQAVLQVPGDSLTQNKQYTSMVEAQGGAQILLVAPQMPDQSALPQLLSQAGYGYQTMTLGEWSPHAASLAPYRGVILDNIELVKLTSDQLSALETYVREGGGLLLIQGRQAVEGFSNPEFERLLPVSYQGPQDLRKPPLALVMILDRSGSMSEMAGGARKIDLLKEAALSTIATLDPRSLIGVIAFSINYQWLIPLQPLQGEHRADLYPSIQELSPGGGTDLYPALEDAITALAGVQARVKHLIVFTDGQVDKSRDFPRLFREIKASGITASSVAIGPDADLEILKALSDMGSGKLYPVSDARDLPQITLEELQRVARNRWVKGTVPVLPGPAVARLAEIDPTSMPSNEGHVLTFAKPTSEIELLVQGQAEQPDPLISYWRYGLGQVAVLNTDLAGEGSASWVRWSGLTRLASALLGQVYSEEPPQLAQLKLATQMVEGHLQATVEAQSEGRWLDQLTLQAQLSSLSQTATPLGFQQVAPGRYEATSQALPEGTYLLQLRAASAQGQPLGEIHRALSMPYPDEYKEIGLDQMALVHIARQTGGLYLEGADALPPVLLGHAIVYHEIWAALMLAGLALFTLDLIARKLPRLN